MTEIWYTVGPSCLDREAELLTAGATGARLTFSFGTTALQLERARKLKATADRTGLTCKVIADLPGGKTRLGSFVGDARIAVKSGDTFLLRDTDMADPAGEKVLPVPQPRFLERLTAGDVIAVGDGCAFLRVVAADGTGMKAVATVNGEIQHHRGLVVQGEDNSPQCMTERDWQRLREIAASSDVDAVAISFVGSAADLIPIREIATRQEVIAKIETPQGLKNLGEICRMADSLVAARGDLALSLPWPDLPDAVRRIADTARAAGKPWYLATQIAEGSARDGFPTRAEICDLAHWRAEGCAGALLSYETAFGNDPVAAVAHTAELLRRWSSRTVLD